MRVAATIPSSSLSDAAAGLANHEGRLWLNGLTTLSDAAAEALASHEDIKVSDEVEEIINEYRT